MNVKSNNITLTLLVSLIGLSLGLFGCGTNTAPAQTNQPSATSSPPPTTSASEPAVSPQTPLDTATAQGLTIYNNQCKVCHGTSGSGGSGPRLIGKSPSASFIQANMPRNKPGSLSSEQVNDLVAYINSLK